jgi:D-sedoheptulose 7-phosphate isomerase
MTEIGHFLNDRLVEPELRALLEARFELSATLPKRFFAEQASQIAQASWKMAQRFHKGGRILAFGNGGSATDAQHVAVEFVHPVIVGKRALPAIALTNDTAFLSGAQTDASESGVPFAHQIALFARPEDMAIGFSLDGQETNILNALLQARKMGLLTLGLTGGDGGPFAWAGLDIVFMVPSQDGMVIQEIHETLYHILWETVHIYFEHEGLLT